MSHRNAETEPTGDDGSGSPKSCQRFILVAAFGRILGPERSCDPRRRRAGRTATPSLCGPVALPLASVVVTDGPRLPTMRSLGLMWRRFLRANP